MSRRSKKEEIKSVTNSVSPIHESLVSDKKAIACNYVESTSECAEGALCYIRQPNGGNCAERIEILARSRSGRWIIKWESTHRLSHFRFKAIPAQHPRYNDDRFSLCAKVGQARDDTAEWFNTLAERLRRERSAKLK